MKTAVMYGSDWQRSRQIWRSGMLAFLSVLLLAAIALANAPAPPSYAWFRFTDAANHAIPVQVAQLAECRTIACEAPVLLLQTGSCREAGCLTPAPALTSPPNRLDCAGNTCLYVEQPFNTRKTGPYFKLIAQLKDGVRSTPGFPLSFKNPLNYRVGENLHVTVQPHNLAIEVDKQPNEPSRAQLFWLAFGVTEVSELAVAALWLWRMGTDRPLFTKLLVAIAFINLLTFPVVWLFFPSLQPFQYRGTRILGVLSLIMAIGFSTLLATRSTVTVRTIGKLLLGWFLALPLLLVIGFFATLTFAYGEWLPAANGLTASITLPASEIYAVLMEAWLIHRVDRAALSLPRAALLSLLMNLASMLLGFLLFPAVSHVG